MKVLFLDFDGVLNTHSRLADVLDFSRVSELNRVVAATGCSIVLATSWRCYYSLTALREMLHRAGFLYPESVVSKTPSLPDSDRSEEIYAWLAAHTQDVDTWAIIDDSYIKASLRPRTVQTSRYSGLTVERADELIRLLGKT